MSWQLVASKKMKETYEINNFIDLSIDLNKPLNKTHRIKVNTTSKHTFIWLQASNQSINIMRVDISSFYRFVFLFYILFSHSTHVTMHRAIMLCVVRLRVVCICFNVIVNSFN